MQTEDEKLQVFPHEVVVLNAVKGYPVIKAWRCYYGLSIEQLAHKAGLTVLDVENADCSNAIDDEVVLNKLSDALGVDSELLIDDD